MDDNFDSISIDLFVEAVQADKDDIWMSGSLEILINGKKPYEEGEIIDEEAVFDSFNSDGEYFIFSCSCGVPECSARTTGIKVIKQGKIIQWIDRDNNKSWKFDSNRIKEDLDTIKEEVKNFKLFFKNKGIDYVGVGYAWK